MIFMPYQEILPYALLKTAVLHQSPILMVCGLVTVLYSRALFITLVSEGIMPLRLMQPLLVSRMVSIIFICFLAPKAMGVGKF